MQERAHRSQHSFTPFQIQRATFLTHLYSLPCNRSATTMACTICIRKMQDNELCINERYLLALQNHHTLQPSVLTHKYAQFFADIIQRFVRQMNFRDASRARQNLHDLELHQRNSYEATQLMIKRRRSFPGVSASVRGVERLVARSLEFVRR